VPARWHPTAIMTASTATSVRAKRIQAVVALHSARCQGNER
jgi:hypothetical protein